LRHKGRERGDEAREVDQHLVERREGSLLISACIARPEASSASPHIPIGERVDEGVEMLHGLMAFVLIELLSDFPNGVIELRKDVAIEPSPLLNRRTGILRRKALDARIGREEGVDVPDLEEEFANGIRRRAIGEARALPRNRSRIKRPPNGVGARLLHELERIGIILLALAELFPLLIRHQTENDAVPKRMRLFGLGEEKGAHR